MKEKLKTAAALVTGFFTILVIVGWFAHFLFGSVFGLGLIKPIVTISIIGFALWWLYTNRIKVKEWIVSLWNKLLNKVEGK